MGKNDEQDDFCLLAAYIPASLLFLPRLPSTYRMSAYILL
ncbi:hypothetical protein HMPREF0083_02764 [Aneurinibacillus aneurinilyticus ATCC 12856]|uniref:Uncharacterized protein n=1 Tax=Aneurinibacillus aneurinilyticus ATCC 12856 TaxID=649747 RepID=U1WKY4_ANEAE|nr:hypothetical protein HMPREF0083_02764 [Aneurinibacillus aneurinilyticus ATCC 12856]